MLWLVQQRTRNAGIVDVGWAGSFAGVAGLFAWRAASPIEAWLPIAVIVTAWSARLTGYLIARGPLARPRRAATPPCARSGAAASRRLFVFFQAQAALTGLLSTAFVVPFVATPDGPGWLRAAGATVSAIGILGETIADAQLARWKRDPAQPRPRLRRRPLVLVAPPKLLLRVAASGSATPSTASPSRRGT